MNKVMLIGRLTRNPDINWNGEMCIARYTLAVDRRRKENGESEADFPSCVVFGKGAEFAQKYLFKGTKIAVVGRLQTGSYVNREGVKVYTTDVIVESQEFVEKKAQQETQAQEVYEPERAVDDAEIGEGFMDCGSDDLLPFT